MFQPDLLTILRESYGTVFSVELSHVVTTLVVFTSIKIIRIGL
jgi:hypothetical protein